MRIGFVELGDPRLLPDMGVKVSFQADELPKETRTGPSLLIPAAAVISEGGTDAVFVVRDGVVERRAISLGGNSGDRVEVKAGLREGDSVVVDPPERLADGDRVHIE